MKRPDKIRYEADCEYCGSQLYNFESTSGRCWGSAMTLDELLKESGKSATFNALCDNCHKWNDFYIIPPTGIQVGRGVRPVS